jgi:hypothetical protein
VKRSVTAFLCLVTVAVGFWVISGAHTLAATCTLDAHSGGGAACDLGLPFRLLGFALVATGVVGSIVALLTLLRSVLRRTMRAERSTISTLHTEDVESLRDVA